MSLKILKSKSLAISLLLFLTSSVYANSLRIFSLSADEWSRPRNGAVIAEMASIRAAVGYWQQAAGNGILIRYPGEDSGEIWATELRDWLVSLGIPTDYIELVSGSQSADEIRLIVGKREDFEQ